MKLLREIKEALLKKHRVVLNSGFVQRNMFEYFAQIIGSRAVVLSARHAVHKRQHLIFGLYKL